MFITRLLHSKTGKYMLSILLGMGFASFFRKACKGKDCIDYSAPLLRKWKVKITNSTANATNIMLNL